MTTLPTPTRGSGHVPSVAEAPMARPTATPSPVRRPDAGEAARTLADTSVRGALATTSVEPVGWPFGSVAPYGLLADGTPVLCISTLAEHTKNLIADPRASLLIVDPYPVGDPMDNGRLTLLGTATRLDPGDRAAAAREAFLDRNPDGIGYVDYGDFSFWELQLESVRWVGGFGRMAWCSVDDYRAAEPDPTAPAAPGALIHLNQDHADALLAAVRAFTGHPDATAATATRLDRYGIDLIVDTPRGQGVGRVGFEPRVESEDGLRAAAVELTRRARAALTGG